MQIYSDVCVPDLCVPDLCVSDPCSPLAESYQYLVPESAPLSSLVAKVKAVDSDLGANADVDYSILDGDPLGMFRIVTDRETQEGLLTLQKVPEEPPIRKNGDRTLKNREVHHTTGLSLSECRFV